MFRRLFSTIAPDATPLDHLPLNVANEPTAESKAPALGEGLSHSEKLALALRRHGKAFQCSADDLPHARLDGTVVSRIVDEAEAWDAAISEAEDRDREQRSTATRHVTVDAAPRNVTTIQRKKS